MPPPSFYSGSAWPPTTRHHCEVFVLQSYVFYLVSPWVSVVQGESLLLVLYQFCLPSPHLMAPKRSVRVDLGSTEATASPDRKGKGILRRTRQATRAQLQAQEAAEFFKEHVPLGIRLEVEKVVGDIWDEVKIMPMETLHKEVADWVLDPSTMAGRASTYDRLLMIY